MSRHDVSPDELARFDRFLTDSVAGRTVAAPVPGLDPTMVAAVQRVRARNANPGPTPEFREQLWQSLMRGERKPTDHRFIRLEIAPESAGLPARARSVPNGSPIRSLAPAIRRGGPLGPRAVSAVATAALLLVTVVAALYVLLPMANESGRGGEQEHLYVASANGQSF